jgi:hypothetical protein
MTGDPEAPRGLPLHARGERVRKRGGRMKALTVGGAMLDTIAIIADDPSSA